MKGPDAETDNSSVDNDENLTPHPHDVLCGRGGQSNNHPGNEWFRRLVRSNRALYRSCPKHTKLLVAKAIVQAVQQQEPPGRFIKPKETKPGVVSNEWETITYGQAVNKTSQALREKEPAGKKSKKTQKKTPPQTESDPDAKRVQFEASENGENMDASNGSAGKPEKHKRKNSSTEDDDSVEKQAGKKRKVSETFVKPSWWGVKPVINRVIATGNTDSNGSISTRVLGPIKTPGSNRNGNFQMGRSEVGPAKSEMDAPIPLTTPLQSRQSSMFRFLSNTGIFGRRDSAIMAEMVTDPAYYGDFDASQQSEEQMGKASVQHLRARQLQNQQNQKAGDMDEMPTSGLLDDSDVAPPPKALKSQMSDWLTSFLPSPSKGDPNRVSFKQAPTSTAQEAAMPPPPGGGANMGRSASSAFFGLVESPSLLLTSLKSGVSSMFGDSVYTPENATMPASARRFSSTMQQQQNGFLGVKTKGSRRDSLLDDVEETDDMRNLRNVKPGEAASKAPRFY